jgi:hypothetical protein
MMNHLNFCSCFGKFTICWIYLNLSLQVENSCKNHNCNLIAAITHLIFAFAKNHSDYIVVELNFIEMIKKKILKLRVINFLNFFRFLRSFNLLNSSLFPPKMFFRKLFQKSKGLVIIFQIIWEIQAGRITHFVEQFDHSLNSLDIERH